LRIKKLHNRPKSPDDIQGRVESIYRDKTMPGCSLRSRNGVKAVCFSSGNKCSAEFSLKLARQSLNGYRIPGPLRLARLAANRFKYVAAEEKAGALRN